MPPNSNLIGRQVGVIVVNTNAGVHGSGANEHQAVPIGRARLVNGRQSGVVMATCALRWGLNLLHDHRRAYVFQSENGYAKNRTSGKHGCFGFGVCCFHRHAGDGTRKTVRAASTVALALAFVASTGTLAMARDNDHCREQVRKAEDKLRREEQKHGANSRQAEKRRRDVERARASCSTERDHYRR
jgi:hypothetical protein